MPRLRALFPLLKQTAIKWYNDKTMKLSAALSMYAVFSLAPLLVISLKVLTALLGRDIAARQIQRQMQSLIGHAGAAAVKDMLLHASQPNAGILATIISSVIVIFSASLIFGELQDSLDIIWGVKLRPDLSWWQTLKSRIFSVAMVFVLLFLLLVSLGISTALTAIAHQLAPNTAIIAFLADFALSVLVVAIVVTMLFRLLPDVRIDWRDVFLGALVTAILFKLGQYLLGLYFSYGSTTSAYGAAGSFVAVLLWAYYSSWILFFGAEFTSVYARSRGRGLKPIPEAIPLTPAERPRQDIYSSPNPAPPLREPPPHLKK